MLVWMNDDAYNLSLNCNSYVVTIQGITYKLLFIRRYFSIKRNIEVEFYVILENSIIEP